MNPTRLACVSAVALGIASAALLTAGPLTPPAGPVSPTFKTLSEVEPRTAINAVNTPGDSDSLFRINRPGSYYLTDNITGVAGKHGIEIAASGVTIDLAGFDLLGAVGSLDAISNPVGSVNLHIRNGSIRDWGDEGVDCTNSESAFIEDVNVRNCIGIGISVGRYSNVSRCGSTSNSGGGIATSFNCTVSGSAVALNGVGGITTGTGCRVVDCGATDNAGTGISAGDGSTIIDCAASDNSSHGIFTGNGCAVQQCSAFRNHQDGIHAFSGCTISQCSAIRNSLIGIGTDINSTITGCTARENGSDGIFCSSGCTVSSCTVAENGGSGVQTRAGCSVTECSARFNGIHGVQVIGAGNLIARNACTSNGTATSAGAGIFINGTGDRIEDNNCSGSDIGIQVIFAGSIIFRNTCAGNTTNWEIAVNNVFGPMVDRRFPGSAAFSGNSAPDSSGTTHPNANFTY